MGTKKRHLHTCCTRNQPYQLAMSELNNKAGLNSICHDFFLFQDSLKKLRVLDDKIIYTLNSSLPTDSFKTAFDGEQSCKQLHNQLMNNYSAREGSISRCIDEAATKVQALRKEKLERPNEISVLQNLRREQSSLRQLQTELSVEEIIKERTLKVFNERCRNFYKPDSL